MARGREGQLLGHTIGHYSLVALLGTGGMAEVYRARDLKLPREVAVKVLPASLAADPSYVARFRSEARRVGSLRHPHIVPVYEFGEHDGLLYLVMPLEPESLRDRLLRRGTLPIADALAVAIQVAGALEAAHAQGIVHRDVKPENILLDQAGHALLTDFGIARELAFLRRQGAVQTLAATGLPVGTPEYMAPEQLRNGPIDQRADVYALGAVLYELLCGVAPHEAGTPYEVAALALTEPITPPSAHNPKVWPALEAAVLTALASDPHGRFGSVADFAGALRAASKPGLSLGMSGGVRATFPIFRKTAIVDPYEGPTREVLIYGSTGVPTMRVGRARGRRHGNGKRGGLDGDGWTQPAGGARHRGRRLFSIVAAVLLAASVAVSGFYVLRTINAPDGGLGGGHGLFLFGPPAPAATATPTTAPIATADPTASASPSATGSPTSTPQPTATATPLPPSLSITPSKWTLPRTTKSYCASTTGVTYQTITNTGANPVSWTWLTPRSTFPQGALWWMQDGQNWQSSGVPNEQSLDSGAQFRLDVRIICPTITTSYTITVLVTDLSTNIAQQQTFTLTAPAA